MLVVNPWSSTTWAWSSPLKQCGLFLNSFYFLIRHIKTSTSNNIGVLPKYTTHRNDEHQRILLYGISQTLPPPPPPEVLKLTHHPLYRCEER